VARVQEVIGPEKRGGGVGSVDALVLRKNGGGVVRQFPDGGGRADVFDEVAGFGVGLDPRAGVELQLAGVVDGDPGAAEEGDAVGVEVAVGRALSDDDGAVAITTDVQRGVGVDPSQAVLEGPQPGPDRKSTRLNSSHVSISYAV